MKISVFILIQFLAVFISIQVRAFEQVLFPGTMANGTPVGAETTWNNPDNAKVEDGVVTSTRCAADGTVLLKATNFNFTIPIGAAILGFKVRVKENENTDVIDKSVVLFDVNGSSAGITDHKTSNAWPSPLGFVTYGSASDLWGRTWLPTDINGTSFGFGISAVRDGGTTQIAEIDVISMSIYYSQPTTIYSGIIYKATLR